MKKLLYKINVIIKLIISFIAVLVTATLLIIGVFSIPVDNIEKNALNSIDTFKEEGTYPRLYKNTTSMLDNFTDALMILNAINKTNEDNISRAMNVYRYDYLEGTPVDMLIRYFSEDNSKYELTAYSRYWHGYLVYLKPALYFTTYKNIRKVNLFIHFGLLIAICTIMFKIKKAWYIVPFILAYGSIMPIANAVSLQFSSCAYIILISSLILLIKNGKWQNLPDYYYIFFMMIGMATSYFDFLTYPAATFGVLIGLYFCLNANVLEPFESLIKFVKYGVTWTVGYIGMWISKWLIASMLLKRNIVEEGLKSVNSRTTLNSNSEMGAYTINGVIGKNFNNWINSPITQLLIILVIIAFLLLVLGGREAALKNTLIIFIPIMLIPFGWYICTGNHSWVHNWMTYKELVIFGFALCCIPAYAFENASVQGLKSNKQSKNNNYYKKHKRKK